MSSLFSQSFIHSFTHAFNPHAKHNPVEHESKLSSHFLFILGAHTEISVKQTGNGRTHSIFYDLWLCRAHTLSHITRHSTRQRNKIAEHRERDFRPQTLLGYTYCVPYPPRRAICHCRYCRIHFRRGITIFPN